MSQVTNVILTVAAGEERAAEMLNEAWDTEGCSPPNPAKITDSRAGAYIEEFGAESWELDALDPDVLTALIRGAIESRLDRALWDEQLKRQERERAILTKTSRNWERVAAFVEKLK